MLSDVQEQCLQALICTEYFWGSVSLLREQPHVVFVHPWPTTVPIFQNRIMFWNRLKNIYSHSILVNLWRCVENRMREADSWTAGCLAQSGCRGPLSFPATLKSFISKEQKSSCSVWCEMEKHGARTRQGYILNSKGECAQGVTLLFFSVECKSKTGWYQAPSLKQRYFMLLEITPWLRNPEVHVMPKTMETESLSETSRAWRASGRNTI